METGLKIAIIVLSVAVYILGARSFIHMFQQNSYKPRVQMKWYAANKGRIVPFVFTAVIFAISCVLKCAGLSGAALASDIVTILILALTAFGLRPKQYKKPLVYTMRVIRLFVTLGILLAAAAAADILALCMEDFFLKSSCDLSYTLCAAVLIPLLILIANLINRPVEKSVARYYINDAKRMLKESTGLTVIGVTGSYGKTSVKYYLTTLLKARYNVLMTPESYNTPMGVVKTIRSSLKATHNMFVCEMGARNVGDIEELCELVHPVGGVITSIGEQHLESFKSIDNIINTKFELEAALPEDGVVFLNGDNEYIAKRKLAEGRRAVIYGTGENCDYRAHDIKTGRSGCTFSITAPQGESCEFTTRLLGGHNVINITGAVAVAHTYGIPLNELVPQVRKLEGVPHRLQLIQRNGVTIIDDAYNSNPSGAKAALEVLGSMEGIRILVTPGMVELGSRQAQLNKEFGAEAVRFCDYIITVGKQQSAPICEGVREAGFDEARLYAAESLNEALNYAYSIKGEGYKIILLENDLPDNMEK